jgi:hypothetical protein
VLDVVAHEVAVSLAGHGGSREAVTATWVQGVGVNSMPGIATMEPEPEL